MIYAILFNICLLISKESIPLLWIFQDHIQSYTLNSDNLLKVLTGFGILEREGSLEV
jgi:hypothetical protein